MSENEKNNQEIDYKKEIYLFVKNNKTAQEVLTVLGLIGLLLGLAIVRMLGVF